MLPLPSRIQPTIPLTAKDADINKDGYVQMSELGEYVKKRVSELTNNKQTPNTRRVNLEGDFPLATAK
jgi:hypothetical protein